VSASTVWGTGCSRLESSTATRSPRPLTRSSTAGDCVEVAIACDRVAARDSKDPQGPNLAFTPEAWTAFVHGVARGDFPADA
jgi:hypothetical protein